MRHDATLLDAYLLQDSVVGKLPPQKKKKRKKKKIEVNLWIYGGEKRTLSVGPFFWLLMFNVI